MQNYFCTALKILLHTSLSIFTPDIQLICKHRSAGFTIRLQYPGRLQISRNKFNLPEPVRPCLIPRKLQKSVAEFRRDKHHARDVERPLEKIALGRLRHCAVTVQIPVPFPVFIVLQMRVGILMRLSVHFKILLVTGSPVSIQGGDKTIFHGTDDNSEYDIYDKRGKGNARL